MVCLLFVSLFIGQASADNSGTIRPNVIYGDDNRKDLYQVSDRKNFELADSVVSFFPYSNVRMDPDQVFASLTLVPFGESQMLCRSERFFTQPTGAFCSGSLVGDDLVLTAAHCIDTETECANSKVVFGFGINNETEIPRKVLAQDVYQCADIVASELNSAGADYSLIRLDRKVQGHKPLQVERLSVLKEDDSVFVIGHPSGLPTKIADGASVRETNHEAFFVANLDTYGGNSGSPVFNGRTRKIEGVLVRGEDDFVFEGNCQVSKRCSNTGCRGEDVTKSKAFASHIP